MIKNVKQTGCHLGKYSLPKGKHTIIQSLDFEAIVETDGDTTVSMSIIASYCLDDKTTGENILTIPCSTNFQFEIEGDDIHHSELEPLWKSAVKNLRDKCNETNEPSIKNIPYPPNDMVRASVVDFLKRWAESPEKEEE